MNTKLLDPKPIYKEEIQTLLMNSDYKDDYDSICRKFVRFFENTDIRFLPKKKFIYDLEADHLAFGGYGSIYDCKIKNQEDQRSLVVKTIPFKMINLVDVLKEIEIHALLNDHENVVTLRHVSLDLMKRTITRASGKSKKKDEFDGCIYLIMDKCEMDLVEYCETYYKDGLQEDLDRIFYEVVSTLDHLHQHNVIHRDLKPANIMLVKSPNCKKNTWIPQIIDFGIATFKNNMVDEKYSNMTQIGTGTFMAPEIRKGKGYDEKVDIYALFVTYFQCKTYTPDIGSDHWSYVIDHGKIKKGSESLTFSSEKNFKAWKELMLAGTDKDPTIRPTAFEIKGHLDSKGYIHPRKLRQYISIVAISLIFVISLMYFLLPAVMTRIRCDGSSCKNAGICSASRLGSIRCDCSRTVYDGAFCEISKCSEDYNPCKNGGICSIDREKVWCDCEYRVSRISFQRRNS